MASDTWSAKPLVGNSPGEVAPLGAGDVTPPVGNSPGDGDVEPPVGNSPAKVETESTNVRANAPKNRFITFFSFDVEDARFLT